jgi:energy-coupling factor transporter ATP-binding protein EcfA2
VPYSASLDELADQVLASPQIRRVLDRPPDYVRPAYVRDAFLALGIDQILNEAAPAISDFNEAENDVVQRRERMYEIAARTEEPHRRRLTVYSRFMASLSALVIIAALLWVVVTLRSIGISGTLGVLTTIGRNGFVDLGWVILVGFVIWASARMHMILRLRLEDAALITDDMHRAGGLDEATKRLQVARAAADQAVLVAALQRATVILNERIDKFFQGRIYTTKAPKEMRVSVARGLGEGVNPQNEVGTEERERVMEMLVTLPAASIGVAGPRGAGKSTLLWSICGANPTTIGNKSAIAVNTSAPVQYDAREFLLHIYSSVCAAVLRAKNLDPDESRRDPEQQYVPSSDQFSTAFRLILRMAPLLVASGILLVCLAVTADFVLSAFSPSTVAVTTAAASGSIASSAARQSSAATWRSSIGNAFSAAAASWLQLGATLIVIGTVSVFITFQYLPGFRIRRLEALREREEAERSQRRDPGLGSLEQRCFDELTDIRFQRSFTSGWSGSLKAVPGLEAGLNAARTLAQQQRTLPEIVSRFIDLLKTITVGGTYGRVVIAIDELDKLSSDEDAQRFLNEIKAIFNVPNCYYVISVSENAISAFERRGLPFRDAFDSAFDDIVYVDYLKLDEARELLSRRVLNLPGNFVSLAYALSAGLPRDLIRVTRAIMERAEGVPNENALHEVCAALVQREVRNKLRATAIAARKTSLEPYSTAFVAWLVRLGGIDLQSPELVDCCDEPLPSLAAGTNETDTQIYRQLVGLRVELDAFIAYAVTVMELFGTIVDEASWKAADAGWVQGLAAARQALELGIARYRIDCLRSEMGLTRWHGMALNNISAAATNGS